MKYSKLVCENFSDVRKLSKIQFSSISRLLPKIEGQQKFGDCERMRSQSYLDTIPFNHTGGRTTSKEIITRQLRQQ